MKKSALEPEPAPASDSNTSQEPESEGSSDVDPEPDPADDPQEVTAVEPQPANEGDEVPPVTAESDTASESGAVEEIEDAPPADEASSPSDKEPVADNDESAVPEEDAAPSADDVAVDPTDGKAEEAEAPAEVDQDADKADDRENDVAPTAADAEESKDDAPKGEQTRVALSNEPPVANDDQGAIATGEFLFLRLLTNDTDADGDRLTIAEIVDAPAHGTALVGLGKDVVNYIPDDGFVGTDSFTYRATDGIDESNLATVTITVFPNDPSVAEDDAFTVEQDTTLTVDGPGLLANDFSPRGLPLIMLTVTQPSHGTVDIFTDGSFTYTPEPGFFGTDSFTYNNTDRIVDSDPATVTITVTEVAANQPPVAVDDTFTVAEDATLTVDAPGLLANDSDPDDDQIVRADNTLPAHGSLTGPNLDGSFTYIPFGGFFGTDSFTYFVTDGTDDSNVATVTIEVTHVNHPPVAGDLTFTAAQGFSLTIGAPGLLLSAVDEDHDPLTALLVDGVSHGTVDLGGDGSLTYTSDADFVGDDRFTYQVSDGIDLSAVQTVTFHVLTVPVGAEDEYATSIDTPLSVDAASGVLANDTDPERDPLTAELVPGGGPGNGTIDLKADGSFIYTPNAGFLGLDFFEYQPSDGKLTGEPVSVTIIVGSPPVGVPDSYATDKNTTLTVDPRGGVLANDVDPNGVPLTAFLQTGTEQGNITAFALDGSFTFVPKPGFSGTVHFAYHPEDDGFSGELTTVTITVRPKKPDPTETATADPTDEPTQTPTPDPTQPPTETPTAEPTDEPAQPATPEPTDTPNSTPTAEPTATGQPDPEEEPSQTPTAIPTSDPTDEPTQPPTTPPADTPSSTPVAEPTDQPDSTPEPSVGPAEQPDSGQSAPASQGDEDPPADDASEKPDVAEVESNASKLPTTGTGPERQRPTDYRSVLLVALALAGTAFAVRRRPGTR